jgi:hypothetical protein
MAILRLSTQMKKAWRQGFMNRTDYNSSHGLVWAHNNNYDSYITIWDGTINDYSGSTKLLRMRVYGTASTESGEELITYNSSGTTAALYSGTATWFHIGGSDSDYWAYGTVGTDGSGADLMIGTTALVSGTQYNFSNIVMKFPSAI